jgi:small subunit ribosomal protein S15
MVDKSEIMAKYRRSAADTGSSEVQIALLSGAIEQLNGHFQIHKKDNHSRRGLLKKVAQRRKLLKYLKKVDLQRYLLLVKQLKLRG